MGQGNDADINGATRIGCAAGRSDSPESPGGGAAFVSVIIKALNEERHI